MSEVDDIASEVLALLDQKGKSVPLEDLVELLEEVEDGVTTRKEAALEDLARQEREEDDADEDDDDDFDLDDREDIVG